MSFFNEHLLSAIVFLPIVGALVLLAFPRGELTGVRGFSMAIALMDDENNDVILNMGWFFPKEGHAFSDYYHSALRRPLYKDFKFVLTEDKNVVMKMKYY